MFDQADIPFLTVETGEAYQPIRLTFLVKDKKKLIEELNHLNCHEKKEPDKWMWHWRDECKNLDFLSVENLKVPHNLRLGSLIIEKDKLFVTLASFKRACLAVSFFVKMHEDSISIQHADFINKVFKPNERLPRTLNDIFNEKELNQALTIREAEFNAMQKQCEEAESAEAALAILDSYRHTEAEKRLAYAERYIFDDKKKDTAEIIYLSFYIYLRSRELVAIKRLLADPNYSLKDACDETIQQVFGHMDIDLLD